jgi:hypothetical protein
MKISIPPLLDFYDSYKPDRAPHVTTITAFIGVDMILGILHHFFESEKSECRITTEEPTAIDSRQRLDRWVFANRSGRQTWYQTEVKNWSVYTQGVSHDLSIGMNDRQLNNYAFGMYRKQWNEHTGCFTDFENLSKVLLPMNPPAGFEEETALVRPLVCYWYPITNSNRTKLTSHFFNLPTRSPNFSEVDIFSASLYLRYLAAKGITTIDIFTGSIDKTLSIMKSFITV